MDNASINSLCFLMVALAGTFTSIVCTCQVGSKVNYIPYSQTIVNHTIVGPVMSSITSKNERECEMECHLANPNLCYMFNYHPSSKVCELLYKDRAAEYKVEKKDGATFRTRKCESSSCDGSQNCVAIGDQNNTLCLNFTGRTMKASPAPVCIGSTNASYGTFFVPADGKIKTFKLVHISGGVENGIANSARGYWGTVVHMDIAKSNIEFHITDHRGMRVNPATDYPRLNNEKEHFSVPGFTVMSPELVFPEISPPLAVTKGKEFRIWHGEDLVNNFKTVDNKGVTCADVFVYYTT